MPTSKCFEQCPPFPSDLPVLDLKRVSLAALEQKCPVEGERLLAACKEWGFFLLDMDGSDQGTALLRDAEEMFGLTADLSTLDEETLNKYHHKAPDFTRYKAIGTTKTAPGTFDHIHVYSLSQDDILETTPSSAQLPHPDTITHKKAQTYAFLTHSHAVLSHVLTSLNTALGIAPGTLSALTPLTEPSSTIMRLIWSPPSPHQPDYTRISFGGHTDMGIMTLLFNVLGGLQVLPPGAANIHQNWQFVRPQPGCAIVNVADTLEQWTGGLLRSCLHRVVTPPGDQAMLERRSVAYLLRPRQDASLARFVGGIVPPLQPGEVDETRTVDEWIEWRSRQIVKGQLKNESRVGGEDRNLCKDGH
ncbi:oxidoreductase [Aspergillus steynii IBT 23096]|uniref:Oxidoreductase n=1 Tax=Aspergillus steynii IBT 23096 TaxID=1392250 RepID=A0A2I2GMK9_9EURO|nr:oxidoreductase [Aspergillus steynii IBT 23096]PLB54131.1 oxidoreductase [Aspergillus steynii IBT 23096]